MTLAEMNALHRPRPGRAERLVEAIKLETRWLLISAPTASDHEISEDFATLDRRQFVSAWPAIRNRRLPAADLEQFYTLVADRASAFAHLIEIRRMRARARSARQ